LKSLKGFGAGDSAGPFPEGIDLVYLWYGGKEPPAGVDKCRACDNGELYWSLKSVDRFAPWFSKIFVLVNDGTAIPEWLGQHPKVRVFSHSEVIPHEILPLENPVSIEFWLHRLPGLSEHFVYANDDMFLGRDVVPGDFFDGPGRMICRYERRSSLKKVRAAMGSTYYDQLRLSRKFLDSSFDSMPHHNMDGYLKSVIEGFWHKHPDECRRSGSFRHRVRNQLSRDVFSLYAMKTGRGVLRWSYGLVRLRRLLGLSAYDSMYANIEDRGMMEWIAVNRPKMFCLNDTERSTDADRARIAPFLEGVLGKVDEGANR